MIKNFFLELDVFFQERKKIIILGFLLALYLPFINLPPYYDDEIRFTYGVIGLFEQGRIIPDLFFRFVTAAQVADVYIFNLVFCALLSLILFKLKYFKENYFLFIVVFSNAFLMENLSYHVDIIGMMMAYIFGIYAAFYENTDLKKMFLISFLLSSFSLICYQSSLNIFATSVVCVGVLDWIHHKKTFRSNLIVRILAYVSMIIFSKVILITIGIFLKWYGGDIGRLHYVEKRSTFDLFAFNEQIQRYVFLIYDSLNVTQLSIIALLICSFVFIRKHFYYYFLTLFICGFLIFFPYVFVDAFRLVQPRVLYGFGGFLLLIYIWLYYSTDHLCFKNVINLMFLIYSIIFLCSVSAYSNSYQKAIELESNVYKKIADTLNNTDDVVMQRCGFNTMIFNTKYVAVNATAFPIIRNVIRSSTSHLVRRTQGIYDLNNLNFIAQRCTYKTLVSKELILNDRYYHLYKLDDKKYQIVYK
ncbi:hypothetical protein G9F32_08625 [Acinetobacter sp. 194]|uniref:glucosyltransferase domain-containing protein n=1 Tax=Acinetobacter shaoyimingii TaxID=2715164 RepID=UPI00140AF44A|nr:glucosyltransferase domain-containing protein [Acinetobacter shaoyimingii]NHB58086.1 hypothetical protein [Acinetobacter shaoyimingii]